MKTIRYIFNFKIKKIFILSLIIFFSLGIISIDAAELPALIIVYDDGYKEDLELVFPIHDKYNVPAVTAVNSNYIGGSLWLDQKELHFLQSKGWEIANHGKKHAALILNSLTDKAIKGEKEISVENSYLLEKSYDYIIFNRNKGLKEKISIQEINNQNGYSNVKIKEGLINEYPENETYLRLSRDSVIEEIIESRLELEEMGLVIDSFVYPYNGYYSLPLELVRKNYNAARAGYRAGESFPEAFINQKPIEKYRLKAAEVEKNLIKESDIFKLLAEVKKEKGLLILYGHPHNENFKADRIEKIIKYALENEIRVTTFRELF